MKERLQSTISKALPPAAAIVLLILVWQLVCSLGDVPKYMLPSPADVIEAYKKDWQLMLSHSRVTLTETFIGLFGGIAVGFIMAVIMDRFTLVRKTVYPLVVISQRPADVSKTILSQCGNFITMRLTNPEDQNVIRRLFPDNLGDFADMLPILDVGECLVVGDASLLPSRVILDKPKIQPNSSTVDFWDKWSEDKKSTTWEKAVKALRQQQKT